MKAVKTFFKEGLVLLAIVVGWTIIEVLLARVFHFICTGG
jgi:hypothetical protein